MYFFALVGGRRPEGETSSWIFKYTGSNKKKRPFEKIDLQAIKAHLKAYNFM